MTATLSPYDPAAHIRDERELALAFIALAREVPDRGPGDVDLTADRMLVDHIGAIALHAYETRGVGEWSHSADSRTTTLRIRPKLSGLGDWVLHYAAQTSANMPVSWRPLAAMVIPPEHPTPPAPVQS